MERKIKIHPFYGASTTDILVTPKTLHVYLPQMSLPIERKAYCRYAEGLNNLLGKDVITMLKAIFDEDGVSLYTVSQLQDGKREFTYRFTLDELDKAISKEEVPE